MKTTKNIIDFIMKWACATNHKQIDALYMFLGGFSVIVGMVLSMAIRFKLAHGGRLLFKGNACMYNLVVTSHALVMIFFFVTPILLWCPSIVGSPNSALAAAIAMLLKYPPVNRVLGDETRWGKRT